MSCLHDNIDKVVCLLISDHAFVLRKLYSELSSTIDAQTIACCMFNHDKLTKRDLDSIQSIRGEPIRSAERLLSIVMEQPCSVYWCFLDALSQAGQNDLRKMIIFESPESELNYLKRSSVKLVFTCSE